MSQKKPQRKYGERIKNSLWWWLDKKRPFIINDEYKIELLHVMPDPVTNQLQAKILVTNLKTKRTSVQEVV